ncbi:unnamed protein product [Hydatigera taeniaeformis]|uniref:Large ribosomal subunit protein eL39 n=1 Tax=Hydatigena taeniaeformis TaxID=6205 RepID=A0A0R3X4R4_HYDTA|nr:unnamed protein product [Hydatigera taeniaeformis]
MYWFAHSQQIAEAFWCVMGAHKTLRLKTKLGKKQRQNRTLPYWARARTGNRIRYNAKRRHWRRTKLKF